MVVECLRGNRDEYAHAGQHDGRQAGDEKGILLQSVPSDSFAPRSRVHTGRTGANLRETVSATSADRVRAKADDHLREASTSSGDRQTDRPIQSGVSDLSETDALVRTGIPKARLLRANVSKIDVPGAESVPEEVRTACYSSDP